MRKMSLKRLAAVIMCLIMVLSLAACGGKSGKDNDDEDSGKKTSSSSKDRDDDDRKDNDRDSDNGGGQSEPDPGNDEGGSVQNTDDGGKTSKNNKDILTIYRVGSDLLAFKFKTDECKKVIGKEKDGYVEESRNSLLVCDETWENQAQFHTNNIYLYYKDDAAEGGHDWANSPYETTPVITEDSYFGYIFGEGLCDKFKLTGTLTIFLSGERDSEELVQVDVSEVTKEVTLEEFADLAGEAYTRGEKLMCDWAGDYLSSQYSEKKGSATIRVTEHGGILIDYDIDGDRNSYVAVERIPDYYSDYSDTYYQAELMLLNFDYDYERTPYWIKFIYTYNGDYSGSDREELRYEWNPRFGGEYKSAYLEKFVEWHSITSDFKDEDYNGLIKNASDWNNDCFKPETDDYILIVRPNDSMYWGEATYKADEAELYCFDVNGHAVYHAARYRFEKEDEAKAYYNELVKAGYTEYTLVGADLFRNYVKDDYMSYTTKFEIVNQASDWRVGGHYFPYLSWEGELYSITYVNKPYTEENYHVSLEDAVYWQGIPSGTHRSLQTKDATMNLTVERSYLSFYTYGTLDDAGNSFATSYSGAFGEPRFTGRKLVAAMVTKMWEYFPDSWDGEYKYYQVITEADFGDTECEIRQYFYRIADAFDTSVTLDNYKTQTAVKTLTQKYDMVRAE